MIGGFIVLFMIICIIGGLMGMPILFAFPVILCVLIIVLYATGKIHQINLNKDDEENLMFTEVNDDNGEVSKDGDNKESI